MPTLSTFSGENVVATAEGNVIQFAVITVKYAASANEAYAKALDRLDRFAAIRDLVASATSYSVTPGQFGHGSYEVNITC